MIEVDVCRIRMKWDIYLGRGELKLCISGLDRKLFSLFVCVCVFWLWPIPRSNWLANLLPNSSIFFFCSPLLRRHRTNSFILKWSPMLNSHVVCWIVSDAGNRFLCLKCFRFISTSLSSFNKETRQILSKGLCIQFYSMKKNKTTTKKKNAHTHTQTMSEHWAMFSKLIFSVPFTAGHFNLSYKNRHMGLQLLSTINVNCATRTFLLEFTIFQQIHLPFQSLFLSLSLKSLF